MTKVNKSDEDRIVNGYEAGEKISWTDRAGGQNIFLCPPPPEKKNELARLMFERS